MTNDLFLAILSMDAYNRTGGLGTPRALVLPAGTTLGNATVLSGVGGVLEDPASGFFGQAYQLPDGTRIISYRGTDFIDGEKSKDILSGWPVGGGIYEVAQAGLAAKFFQQVVAGSANTTGLIPSDLYNANIVLTGHSLGGGLAGLVGSLYGAYNVRIFDSMAFQLAASRIYANAMSTDPVLMQVKETYFLDQLPTQQVSGSGIQSFGVQYQAIGGFQSDAAQTTYSLGFSSLTALGPIQRHSQSLLVIRMYGEDSKADWLSAGSHIFTQLFNESLANALGIQEGGATGYYDANSKLRGMIAYSAIDQGSMPYGDKGIRAFYNDAKDLGSLIASSSRAEYLKDDRVLDAIAGIGVQYAGLLAVNAEQGSSDPDANTGFEKGAIFYDAAHNRLVANFSRSLWAENSSQFGNRQVDVVGKRTLTDAVSDSSGTTASSTDQAVTKVWSGNTNHIVALIAATTDNMVTLDAVVDALIGQGASAQPSDGAMLVGGGGDDTLRGASGNDLLAGGKGKDNFDGKGGDDLLFGGADNDTFLLGYGGTDWVDGGAGEDTTRFSQSDHGRNVVVSSANGLSPNGEMIITAEDKTTGKLDYLTSVEIIELSSGDDKLSIRSFSAASLPQTIKFDLKASSSTGSDTVDFSEYGTAVYLKDAPGSAGMLALYKDSNFSIQTGLQFQNFNKLILSSQADKFNVSSTTNLSKITQIDAGANANGTQDAIDFSAMSGGSGVTIVNRTLVATQTKLDNFEKIVGSSGIDNIQYSNGKTDIEVHGGGNRDIIVTGGGNDKLFGGSGIDTLMGRRGSDEYTGGAASSVTIRSSSKRSGSVIMRDAAGAASITTPRCALLAYGFLIAERAAIPPSGPRSAAPVTLPRLPEDYRPRGAACAA